jgi:hypothetical protein
MTPLDTGAMPSATNRPPGKQSLAGGWLAISILANATGGQRARVSGSAGSGWELALMARAAHHMGGGATNSGLVRHMSHWRMFAQGLASPQA